MLLWLRPTRLWDDAVKGKDSLFESPFLLHPPLPLPMLGLLLRLPLQSPLPSEQSLLVPMLQPSLLLLILLPSLLLLLLPPPALMLLPPVAPRCASDEG